jgi:membrane-associated phospholipid phosphatase
MGTTKRTDRLLGFLSLACCIAALMLTFIRLIEFDVPLTRFVRSLNEYHIDYLHNPWLRQLSDGGDRAGKGESLLVVSAVFLAAGYALRRPVLKRAGWETLVAHLVAGGLNTVLKHLVGRGRPKFMHGNHSEFVPFGGSGWDSFPSGHSMATFAVATVLAVRFPKVRWLVILIALAVSLSRLFRASHFLTDIVAGAVLGVLVGAVVAHPWNDRRAAFTSALIGVTPPLALLLAVMTTIGQPPSQDPIATILSVGGLLIVLAAMTTYVLFRLRPVILLPRLTAMGAVAVMGIGIAMSSLSIWVAMVIALVWFGQWLNPEKRNQEGETASNWPTETAFGLGVLLTLLTMMELRGALPLG